MQPVGHSALLPAERRYSRSTSIFAGSPTTVPFEFGLGEGLHAVIAAQQ